MMVAQTDDFFEDLSQRAVMMFAMWLEEQEHGQELVAALYHINDVLARQEAGQMVSAEDVQAAFDATLRLQVVTISSWKPLHTFFEKLAERFLSLLPDASERMRDEDDWDDENVIDTLGRWWCEDCEAWHVGCFCPKDDGE